MTGEFAGLVRGRRLRPSRSAVFHCHTLPRGDWNALGPVSCKRLSGGNRDLSMTGVDEPTFIVLLKEPGHL